MESLKKLAAILLIAVLFFNWYGYRLLTAYWRRCADISLQNRLDNNGYDTSSLISIKIPITKLTYYESEDEWERYDGEMILGDVAYRFVKRRIHNDSVEFLCLRNNAEMQLKETGNTFFRLVNNLTHFPGSKSSGNIDPQKVYSFESTTYILAIPNLPPIAPTGFLIGKLRPGHSRLHERPPQAIRTT